MSFNGSGTFLINTAGQPVVAGTVISSTAFNALTADLATGLSTVITKDGQTTVTANIPMSTYKFTGLGVGSAATDSANLSQVQSTVTKLLTSVSGTDTITAVGAPVVAAYAAGQMFYFVATGDNTGAVTLNIDSLGAKAVTRDGSVALAAGDIKSGEVVVVVYDGTRFQVVSQLNSAGDARFANVSIASSLYVGGVSTFVGNAGFSANVSIASALSVGGVAAITGATTIGGNLTLNGGTANGVLYLNGSKVATSGSALTFDGTTLATTGKFGITGSGAVPTASALQIGTNAAGSRWLYNVPTGGEHNFTENGTVLSWQNISSLGWLIGGSEQMRLTSTGLGIGTSSPAAKLHVLDSGSTGTMRLGGATFYGSIQHDAVTTGANIYNSQDTGGHLWQNSGSTVLTLSNGGNLGLGVTPSAWNSAWKAIQAGNGAAFQGQNNSASVVHVSGNAYIDSGGVYRYIGTEGAQRYRGYEGAHEWFTAASGTAGNAISFTQAMTLDASGNLGVGVTSPSGKIACQVTASGTFQNAIVASDGTSSDFLVKIKTNETQIMNSGSSVLSFGTSNTERARITSGGDFELGTNAGTGTRTLTIQTNTSGDPTISLSAAGADAGSFWFERSTLRLYARASNTGGVYLASGGTSWTAVSDERKKDIIEPISNAAEKVASLRAVVGKYKTDKDGVRRSFLIAQDVQAVFPEAIDASDENELGLSYTDTIPLLVAAIKELTARVAQLETK